MADETKRILVELEFDTIQAVKNQKELKDLLKATNKELEAAQIGSEEYKKLEVVQGQLQKRLKGLGEATKATNSELGVQKGSLRDLQNQYGQLTKALREAAPGSQILGQSFDDAKKKAFELKEQIKDFEAQLGNTAPNVGNYGNAFKDAVGGVELFGVSLGNLFKLILGNPIGLIIAALTGLFKILMQNDDIATAFKGVMTGLGVAFDQIAGFISAAVLQLANFGGESSKTSKLIKDVFIRVLNAAIAPITLLIELLPALAEAMEGNFSKAADIAGEASLKFGKSIVFLNDEVPEFVENLGKAVNVGLEYEKSLDGIAEKQNKLNVTIARLINQRDKLALQAKDLSKSEEEAIKLREQAEDINKRILAERLALLDEEIAVQAKYANQLGKGTSQREDAEFRLRDLQVKRLEFENEALKFEEANLNKKNALIEKQRADQAKADAESEKARKKREEDETAFIERSTNSQVKLTQFKLDQAAKTAKDADERLKAQLKAEDFRVAILLDNEKLLASEREFILADSAARVFEINKSYEEKTREEAKKTADAKIAAVQKTEDQIVGFLNQAANTANVISDTRANKEITALNKKQAQEVKAAGNNKAKIEEINKAYDEKRAEAEREAAIRNAEIAKTMAIINGAQAFTKSLTAAPFPINLILAAGTAVATVAQVAKINSEQDKLGLGGLVKMALGGLVDMGKFMFGGTIKNHGKAATGMMIGGKPHSAGGTKFFGTDGTRFEAEKGELLAIVNKQDTPLLSMLSSINSIHGRSFFQDGGIQPLNDGGYSARYNSQPIASAAANRNELLSIIEALPPNVVGVEDITSVTAKVVKVKSRADI